MQDTVKQPAKEMTGFGIKSCLYVHILGWKISNDEKYIGKSDDKIFIYSEKYTRHFVQESIKGGEVGAFNQIFESPMAQNIMKVIKKNSNYSQIKKYSRLIYEVRKRLFKKVLN